MWRDHIHFCSSVLSFPAHLYSTDQWLCLLLLGTGKKMPDWKRITPTWHLSLVLSQLLPIIWGHHLSVPKDPTTNPMQAILQQQALLSLTGYNPLFLQTIQHLLMQAQKQFHQEPHQWSQTQVRMFLTGGIRMQQHLPLYSKTGFKLLCLRPTQQNNHLPCHGANFSRRIKQWNGKIELKFVE